ncbi:UDP-N-acetylmuramate dehydrogenase [bacterium]|nr:UDP-N-acetylmuramate dehydrogenase [bacterium]
MSWSSSLVSEIRKIAGERLRENEPMSRHTSLRIGGPARIFVRVNDPEELDRIIALVRDKGLRIFILGAGSNLLVRDEGLKEVVVKLEGDFKRIEVEGERLFAGAGAGLKEAVRMATENGLSGLEFACGIPGTVGGAVIMNASFLGHSISEIVKRVKVLSVEGEVVVRDNDELAFSYRKSRIGGIVLEAELLLKKGQTAKIEERILRFRKERERLQPKGLSAGCIFKNPQGDSAGRLIEAAGLKGRKAGGAQISDKHANFILNIDQASSLDVLTLIEQAREKVRNKFGVELKEEIVVV